MGELVARQRLRILRDDGRRTEWWPRLAQAIEHDARVTLPHLAVPDRQREAVCPRAAGRVAEGGVDRAGDIRPLAPALRDARRDRFRGQKLLDVGAELRA